MKKNKPFSHNRLVKLLFFIARFFLILLWTSHQRSVVTPLRRNVVVGRVPD